MKRTGSSISRSATLAPRFPPFASSCSRVRRAVTSAYSATTKNAFPAMRRNIRKKRRPSLTPRLPGRAV